MVPTDECNLNENGGERLIDIRNCVKVAFIKKKT